MTMRLLLFLILATNCFAVDTPPLVDENFLPILSKKTLSTQKSVYSLHLKDEQIALACAFTEGGFLLTSLDKFEEGILIKDSKGGLFPVEFIGTDRKSHLTVLRAPFKLTPLTYGSSKINTGKFLVAVNPTGALSMGIVSLAPYEAIQSNFYHSLRFPLDARPKILYVEPNSPEEEAGLKVGDIINSINGDIMFSGRDTLEKLRSLRVNEKIQVDIIRKGEIFKTAYKPQKAKEYNTLPKRMVFQHDIPLTHNQHGGPICLINGKFVGISLAYATPSGSYSIKANECAKIALSLIRNRNKNSANK